MTANAVTSAPRIWKTSRAAKWAALIGLAMIPIAMLLHPENVSEMAWLYDREDWGGLAGTLTGYVLAGAIVWSVPVALICSTRNFVVRLRFLRAKGHATEDLTRIDLKADPEERVLITPTEPPPQSTSPVRRSYFIRHWQGKLSLPVSYWINYLLATVLVAIISIFVGESIDPAKGLVTWAIAISCVCIFGIIATIWQFVGVWRSAGNHKSRGGRGFWAGAARGMVVLGVLGFVGTLPKNVGPQLIEVWKIASGDPEIGSHHGLHSATRRSAHRGCR